MDHQQIQLLHQKINASKAILEVENWERNKIAGELHEQLGQTLSAVKMNLSAIESTIPSNDLEQQTMMEKLIAMIDQSCKELRHLSHLLMPKSLLKLGLIAAIQDYIQHLNSKTVKINFYAEGVLVLKDWIDETILYKLIQEILNQAINYSGASQLDISLISDKDGLSITIEDNGSGVEFPTLKNADWNIKSIQSRIDFLNAVIEWNNRKGSGTVVAIHLPKI